MTLVAETDPDVGRQAASGDSRRPPDPPPIRGDRQGQGPGACLLAPATPTDENGGLATVGTVADIVARPWLTACGAGAARMAHLRGSSQQRRGSGTSSLTGAWAGPTEPPGSLSTQGRAAEHASAVAGREPRSLTPLRGVAISCEESRAASRRLAPATSRPCTCPSTTTRREWRCRCHRLACCPASRNASSSAGTVRSTRPPDCDGNWTTTAAMASAGVLRGPAAPGRLAPPTPAAG